jgi:hypothetical protein
MEATTAGKGRVSPGKRQLQLQLQMQRASTSAMYLLQDPQLQQAVDRQWKRVSRCEAVRCDVNGELSTKSQRGECRNGIIEGIAFKQMYKMICAPLFPSMPLERVEQLAHEKWIAWSVSWDVLNSVRTYNGLTRTASEAGARRHGSRRIY